MALQAQQIHLILVTFILVQVTELNNSDRKQPQQVTQSNLPLKPRSPQNSDLVA